MTLSLRDVRAFLPSLIERPGHPPVSFDDCPAASPADVRNYRFRALPPDAHDAYTDLVESAFTGAGIFAERFLQEATGERYGIVHATDGLVGVCACRDSTGSEPLTTHITRETGQPPTTLWEVNNLAVAPRHRGGVAAAFLLFGCAVTAHHRGADVLAGILRSSVLPSLTDFALVPVHHEPLHILGRPEIRDYVAYYDTGSRSSMDYLWERTTRYVHAAHTLHLIAHHPPTQTDPRSATPHVPVPRGI